MPIGPSERIAAAIRADIDDGVLMPGDKLPSERDLVQEHAVSISTIGRAIAQLRSEAYVESRRGLGNFVAPRRPRLQLDPRETLRLTERKATTAQASPRIAQMLGVDRGIDVHVVTWLGHAGGRVVARVTATSSEMPADPGRASTSDASGVAARLPDGDEMVDLGITEMTPVLVLSRRHVCPGRPPVIVDLVYPSSAVHLIWPPEHPHG